ncbi:hypothetical protein CBL_05234 [Carabus blaptoides fortunei]
MYQQIVSLLEYLVENKPEQCPDEKNVIIKLTEDTGAHRGNNIQIDAVGSWIQGFCVRKFRTDLWNDCSTAITVHHGDSSVGTYQRYSVTNTSISVQLVDAPYVEQCEHYLSFVLTASESALHKLHPRLKAQLRVFATQHQDVQITNKVSERLWSVDDENDQCARIIGNALGTVLRYSTSPDFHASIHGRLQTQDTPSVVQTMYNRLYERFQKE